MCVYCVCPLYSEIGAYPSVVIYIHNCVYEGMIVVNFNVGMSLTYSLQTLCFFVGNYCPDKKIMELLKYLHYPWKIVVSSKIWARVVKNICSGVAA